MAQTFRFLPPAWEAQMDFLDPRFSLAAAGILDMNLQIEDPYLFPSVAVPAIQPFKQTSLKI